MTTDNAELLKDLEIYKKEFQKLVAKNAENDRIREVQTAQRSMIYTVC
jgi:hypothetical protein